ncbi:hypothetical protein H0H93_014978 [Arthromyces matolae]|nr:hypothetical protein H0H93_014978 [Arthromyces matolae]
MSSLQNDRSSAPIRTFGVQEPLEGSQASVAFESPPPFLRRVLSRISFSSKHRPSVSSQRIEDATGRTLSFSSERAPIPTVGPSAEVYATPLPTLSMIVLSITMLGEFLCANVSTPFLLFMVKGFDDKADESTVAFWTGVLVSTFFLTQFVTSLLWATVAEKHGRRLVLIISLLGSAITCIVFGTATTLQQAICIRLLQGIFAGAVGVARGCVAFITDPTLYLQILLGSILSCFLGRDGGPREGAIRLGLEKINNHPPIPEEESIPSSPVFGATEPSGLVGKLKRQVSKRFSGYFSHAREAPESPIPPSAVPLATPRLERTRTFSRTSRVNGSAYGYTGSYRNRLNSNATYGGRRGSLASTLRRRRGSNMDSVREAAEHSDLNFAQRLLMANENAVTNIADLWVAAALNVDNEDPFVSDSEGEDDFEQALEEGIEEEVGAEDEARASGSATTPRAASHRPSNATSVRPRDSFSTPRRSRAQGPSMSFSHSGTPMSRRYSTATPSIFTHPGVKAPSAVLDAQQLLTSRDTEAETSGDILDSVSVSRRTAAAAATDTESLMEKSPSLTSQLPILIIVQYGMLALHTTTHDQVFMSYLVSCADVPRADRISVLSLPVSQYAHMVSGM